MTTPIDLEFLQCHQVFGQENETESQPEFEQDYETTTQPVLDQDYDTTSQPVFPTEKPFKCEFCDKSFNFKQKWQEHTQVHLGMAPVCEICNKSFSSRGHLGRHMKIHTGEKVCGCNICGKTFFRRDHLAKHLSIHAKQNADKESSSAGLNLVKQDIFGGESQDITSHFLKVDMQEINSTTDPVKQEIKTEDRVGSLALSGSWIPYKCEYCNECFDSQEDLEIHVRTHSWEKPFFCLECEQTFASKFELSKHMRIHKGDKPHRCEYCHKSFTRKTSLNEHIRIHTGQKPYNCEQCDKSFNSRKNLERHLHVHTGDNPFKCDYCDKSYTQKAALIMHTRKHTGEKPFKCEYCDNAYPSKVQQISHTRNKHKDLFEQSEEAKKQEMKQDDLVEEEDKFFNLADFVQVDMVDTNDTSHNKATNRGDDANDKSLNSEGEYVKQEINEVDVDSKSLKSDDERIKQEFNVQNNG